MKTIRLDLELTDTVANQLQSMDDPKSFVAQVIIVRLERELERIASQNVSGWDSLHRAVISQLVSLLVEFENKTADCFVTHAITHAQDHILGPRLRAYDSMSLPALRQQLHMLGTARVQIELRKEFTKLLERFQKRQRQRTG